MICLICGKNFISVGVHIRHKHGISPEEYREEFGLLKTAPLVDEELSAHLSQDKKRYFALNPDLKEVAAARLKAVESRNMAGSMSKAGREKLAGRNSSRNREYLDDKKVTVNELLTAGYSLHQVQEVTSVAPATVRGMVKAGLVKPYDKDAIERKRREKALETRAKTRETEAAKILALYDTDLSAMEICRRVGVGYTSYKRWVKSGVLPRRNTYMADRLNYPEFQDS